MQTSSSIVLIVRQEHSNALFAWLHDLAIQQDVYLVGALKAPEVKVLLDHLLDPDCKSPPKGISKEGLTLAGNAVQYWTFTGSGERWNRSFIRCYSDIGLTYDSMVENGAEIAVIQLSPLSTVDDMHVLIGEALKEFQALPFVSIGLPHTWEEIPYWR